MHSQIERRHPAHKSRCWVAVASADHVAICCAQGFMQVVHGKRAPLARLRAGDHVAYYSPLRVFGGKEVCQSFTAIGTVRDERVYQGDMGDDFKPFRGDVHWLAASDAPIRPLLDALSFTQGRANWGYVLRFGWFEVTAADMALIAQAMRVAVGQGEHA
jgi:hypothetical protein